MQVNKIVEVAIKDRVCIHCEDEARTTYLIAEPRQGKTTETVRQALFRRCHILSKEYDYFRSVGMKHASEAEGNEIGYLGIRDLLYSDKNYFEGKQKLKICVDGAKGVLEELLTDRFGVPVEIQYMSIEAPRKE